MPSVQSPDRKVLLLFKFSDGPPVTMQSKRAVAEEAVKEGFTIQHPQRGKLYFKFHLKRPDFKRGAILYEFKEVL